MVFADTRTTIVESSSKEDITMTKISQETKIKISESKSEEEQKIVQLLEQIVGLLNETQNLYLILIDVFVHVCEQLNKENEQLNKEQK